jgi:hypothetical protein
VWIAILSEEGIMREPNAIPLAAFDDEPGLTLSPTAPGSRPADRPRPDPSSRPSAEPMALVVMDSDP